MREMKSRYVYGHLYGIDYEIDVDQYNMYYYDVLIYSDFFGTITVEIKEIE